MAPRFFRRRRPADYERDDDDIPMGSGSGSLDGGLESLNSLKQFEKQHPLDPNLPLSLEEYDQVEIALNRAHNVERGTEIDRVLAEDDSPYPEVSPAPPAPGTAPRRAAPRRRAAMQLTVFPPSGPSIGTEFRRRHARQHDSRMDHRDAAVHDRVRRQHAALAAEPERGHHHVCHPAGGLPHRPLLGCDIPGPRVQRVRRQVQLQARALQLQRARHHRGHVECAHPGYS